MSCSKLCSSCVHFDYDEEYINDEEYYGYFCCGMGHSDHIGWGASPCEDYEEDALLV